MAKLDKQAKADDGAAETGASTENKLTRRSFVAKAGLTAAALGVAGSIPAVAASCGSSSSSSSASPGAAGGEATIVRFVFAPDPIWNFMQDTGIVAKWEDRYNFKLVNTTTWDETAWFTGGHADIASLGTYEVPLLQEASGKEFVCFGKYAMARDTTFVLIDSPYQSIVDLKGKRVSEGGNGGTTLLYASMWKKKFGVDFRVGGGDFKVNLQEFVAMPASLEKGDVDGSVGIIDYYIPDMMNEKTRWLYPEAPNAWEYYREYFDPTKTHNGCCSNLFVTTPAWLEANPKIAEAFNVMWQEGVNAWFADKTAIIQAYPDLFTTTNQAEVDWFLKYLEIHDWTVTSVYMDPTWIDKEKGVFTLLKEQGYVKESTPDPVFYAMTSPADAPPEAQPPADAGSSPAPSPSA